MALLTPLAGAARAATLDVVVDNVRDAQGTVRVAVCSQAQFLGEHCEHVGRAPAQPGSVTVRVEGVPPGTWAVQAFHDDNGDGKLTRNFLGLPTKGLGFSNDARFHFGPPRWNDAAFRLGPDGGVVHVPLRYTF